MIVYDILANPPQPTEAELAAATAAHARRCPDPAALERRIAREAVWTAELADDGSVLIVDGFGTIVDEWRAGARA